jgi:hypothetical protein
LDGGDWCAETADYDIYDKQWAKGCRTIKTTGGNSNGADCVFPFLRNKEYHYKCIYQWSQKKYWCGTTENFDADKKYGYCELTGDE